MPSVTDLMGVAAEQSFIILVITTNHYIGCIQFGHWCPPLRNHLKSKFTFKIKYHFDTRDEKAAGNTRSSRKKTHDGGGNVIIVTSTRKCGAGSIIFLLGGISSNKKMKQDPGSHWEDSFSDVNALNDEVHSKNLYEKISEDLTEVSSLLEQNPGKHSL